MVMQHPAVVSYEEEEWNYEGKKRKVYRFEIDDISAYYIRNKLNVVNETPSVLSQILYRLGILPFRWVSIEGNEIKTRDDFPRFFIV
jgi:DNA polymerase I